MPYNLLDDPIIPVVSADAGRRTMTLPALFAFFAGGGEAQIVGMRPHQEYAVHSTFVQIAAAAVDLEGLGDVPADESTWKRALVRLAPIEAWDVFHPDPTQAAFMQPPMDKSTFEAIRGVKTITDPLRMTVLVISKDHVEKTRTHIDPGAWDWIVALIAAQTSLGYSGVGNYGIMRMNGGLGSRPFVGLYPSLAHGDMWRRDVACILGGLDRILEEYRFYSETGIVALWTLPWDGIGQVRIRDLHPLFVDVARRYRIVETGGRLEAVFANSKTTRIADPKTDDGLRGRTGDPWAPLSRVKSAVLTVQETGWTYRLAADVLFRNVETVPPLSLRDIGVGSERRIAVLSVLVGGQGVTGGYHRREIEYPAPVVFSMMGDAEGTRLTLADHCRAMIEEVAATTKILRTAAAALGVGAFDFSDIEWKSAPVERSVDVALSLFDRRVDAVFFPALFERHEKGDATAWNVLLLRTCGDVLDDVFDRLTLPNGVRSRARAAGENALRALWKHPPGHEGNARTSGSGDPT